MKVQDATLINNQNITPYKHQLMNTINPLALILVLLCIYTPCISQEQPADNTVPKWVKKVGARHESVEDRVYYVNDYGAKGDGIHLNTSAIQDAIDHCAKNGGGIIAFKPGSYVTGSLFIKKNIHFRVDSGVKILGSQKIEDYKEIDTRVAGVEMKWPAALINVNGQENVTIEGNGIIDGRGKPFWDAYWDARKNVYEPKGLRWIVDYDVKRPRTILISNSNNISLKELNIQNAGFWTVHILYSEKVTVDGITIKNNISGHGPSTDGIDIDSSKWVLIQNSDIDCNDDNFCLKAGRDWDGLRVNKPTAYVVIKDCIARQGGGLFTIGSETSGGIHHVYVSNIKGQGTKRGLNIKSALTRGGTVKDIYLENIVMDSVDTFMEVSMNWNPSYSYSKLPVGYTKDSIPKHWKKMLMKVPEKQGIPTFKNITLKNIVVKNAKRAINVNGLERSYIQGIHLQNVDIQAQEPGQISYSKNWTLDQVSIRALDGSDVILKESDNINFNLPQSKK